MSAWEDTRHHQASDRSLPHTPLHTLLEGCNQKTDHNKGWRGVDESEPSYSARERTAWKFLKLAHKSVSVPKRNKNLPTGDLHTHVHSGSEEQWEVFPEVAEPSRPPADEWERERGVCTHGVLFGHEKEGSARSPTLPHEWACNTGRSVKETSRKHATYDATSVKCPE